MGERDGRRTGRCACLAEALERAPGVSVISGHRGGAVAQDVPVGRGGFGRACAGGQAARHPGDPRPPAPLAAVAAARRVRLPADVIAASLAFLDALPAAATASMQRDIAEGRPSELEQLSGAVVRLGRASGVDTPVHQFIHAALLPAEMTARAEVP